MPRRPDIPCKHPGCAALIPYGQMYCEKHKPMHTRDRGQMAAGAEEVPASSSYMREMLCRGKDNRGYSRGSYHSTSWRYETLLG